jgi:flagellum-specific peptidoglycan hydrolase FlgJ
LQKQLYVVTKKNADASKELDTEIGHLTSGLKGVGNEILTDLHPALLIAIQDLESLTALARENPKTTEAILGTGVAVGGIFTVVKIAKWIGAVRGVISALVAVKEAATVAGAATEAVTGTAATAEAAIGVAAIGETIAGGITLAGGALMTGALVLLGGISAGMGYMLAKFYKKVFGTPDDKTPWYKKAFGMTDGIDHDAQSSAAAAAASAASAEAGVAAAHVSTPIFRRTDKSALRAEAEKEMAQARKDAGYSPSNGSADVGSSASVALAKASEAKYGVPAAITLAQYQLESSNGKRMPKGSNNPFGIKASKADIASGNFVEAMTKEVINGVEIRLLQKFKKFGSMGEAFDAHAKLLATSKYYAKAKPFAKDPNAYADAIANPYSTEPTYASSLKKLMRPGSVIDRSLMPGAAGSVAQNAGGTSTNTSTSDVKIGSITVNTKATDAPGISKDIGASLQQYAFASNANVGLQ